MKAAVFKAVGQPMEIQTRADPSPGLGGAVIRVARCGICSSDLHMTSGHGVTYPPDSILGHEYSGEVVELGMGVAGLKIGDRVTAMPMTGCGTCLECLQGYPMGCASMQPLMSGYAQYARIAAASAIRLPASVSLADGALIEPLASSLHGVAMAGIRPGSRVTVLGAGTIGLGALYWARRAGASRILAVARSERNRDLALHMGATHFITSGDDLPARARAVLGTAPEFVFECVGAAGALGMAADLAAPRGTIIALGMCQQADSMIPFGRLQSLVVKFSAAYELRDFETAVDAMQSGAVEPRAIISDTISLVALPSEFEKMRIASPGRKVMVDPHAQ